MPTDSCHPIAGHQKLRLPDWYVSGLMLDRAIDAILRRVVLDRSHDIPYLAGYSLNGKTIYIDRHLPMAFKFGDRMVQTDRYLILHEAVEKTLLDQLNLHYQHAHQIALRAEEAAVRADGIQWRSYDRAMKQYIKQIGDEKLERLPADLDRKPYRDEHDRDLISRMDASMIRRGKNAGKGKKSRNTHTAKIDKIDKPKKSKKPNKTNKSAARK